MNPAMAGLSAYLAEILAGYRLWLGVAVERHST
jgi:hypothetical protein